ncbi:MAG TPA: RuvX/YqgF family protein, partial [Acetomicrobium sp.]|nr:RuvX/YqgF family protein [Acetomicrobium sp.]
MGNILALDIGSVRIGVAISDPLGIFAQGVGFLDAKGNWLEELARIINEH